MKVTVPKQCFAGGTFKVTVPVKQSREGEKDGNKLPRDLQEVLDIYGKAYDEWCTAESKVDGSFETFKEKQGKFDKLASLFPKNLVTPIDPTYIKQVVRRARQNKYKRSKTAAAAAKRETSSPTKKDEPADEPQAEDESEEEELVYVDEDEYEPYALEVEMEHANFVTRFLVNNGLEQVIMVAILIAQWFRAYILAPIVDSFDWVKEGKAQDLIETVMKTRGGALTLSESEDADQEEEEPEAEEEILSEEKATESDIDTAESASQKESTEQDDPAEGE